MSPFRLHHAGALALVGSLAACNDANTVTPPARVSGVGSPSFAVIPTSSKLLGRSTFSDSHDPHFQVKRMSPHWSIDIKAKPAFDIAVQTIDFPVGSQSTWHVHPGPVFIQVVVGEVTFYESDDPTCTPLRVKAPGGFLDSGDHAHIARNESGAPAQNVVTYFAPPGALLKTDQPSPGNCPF